MSRNMIDAYELLTLAEDNMFGLGNWGMCRACGEAQEGCEDDARNYECECCGEREVFGAGELVMMGYAGG